MLPEYNTGNEVLFWSWVHSYVQEEGSNTSSENKDMETI